jgi:hypothetical protein
MMKQINPLHTGGKTPNKPVVLMTVELDGQLKTIHGRDAWALSELISARNSGVTPIDRPAPRWSQYIHKLRRAGFNIETIDEKHGGAFSGTHGRYVLRSAVRIIEICRQGDPKPDQQPPRDNGFVAIGTLPLEGIWR